MLGWELWGLDSTWRRLGPVPATWGPISSLVHWNRTMLGQLLIPLGQLQGHLSGVRGSGLSGAVGGGGGHGGAAACERVVRTMREYPKICSKAHETVVKKRMNWAEGDSFSYGLYAREHVLPHAGNYSTLKPPAA